MISLIAKVDKEVLLNIAEDRAFISCSRTTACHHPVQ